jgi:hypothetical protein
MGAGKSKHNTDTLDWNEFKTEDMSITPETNFDITVSNRNIDQDVSYLLNNLNVSGIDLDTDMSDTNNISDSDKTSDIYNYVLMKGGKSKYKGKNKCDCKGECTCKAKHNTETSSTSSQNKNVKNSSDISNTDHKSAKESSMSGDNKFAKDSSDVNNNESSTLSSLSGDSEQLNYLSSSPHENQTSEISNLESSSENKQSESKQSESKQSEQYQGKTSSITDLQSDDVPSVNTSDLQLVDPSK